MQYENYILNDIDAICLSMNRLWNEERQTRQQIKSQENGRSG